VAYNTRVLPYDEWERVRHTEIGPALDALDPAKTKILVIEDDGEIIATWTEMIVIHCEGVWVKESHRNSAAVVRALFRGMRHLVQQEGAKVAWTTAITDTMSRMLRRAVPVPGRHFLLNFSKRY